MLLQGYASLHANSKCDYEALVIFDRQDCKDLTPGIHGVRSTVRKLILTLLFVNPRLYRNL